MRAGAVMDDVIDDIHHRLNGDADDVVDDSHHRPNGGAVMDEAEAILKTIVPPVQAPYSNTILFKDRKYKVFPNDGQRLYLVVYDNAVLMVLDNKVKRLPDKNANLAKTKIKAYFEGKLENLQSGYYVFDVMLGPRSLTVVDLLYENSVCIAEQTWKDRLQRIQSFNFAKGSNLAPKKIKIMDSAPTDHIDLNRVSGRLIVRDLPAFAMFTKEYLISEVEANCRYVIVGEGSLKREFRVTLRPDNYTDLAKIPNGAKKALITLLDSAEERERLAGLPEHEQVQVYNSLKEDFFDDNEGSSTLKYTAYNRVMLLAGKTDDGALAIFGYTKNAAAESAGKTVGFERPPLIVWSNKCGESQFAANTVRYFNPIYLVECKRVNRYKGSLVNVASESLKSYYNTADIHEGHDMYNEIDYVPEVQSNKSNNTLTACSYRRLCREMSARINFDFTQNPDQPETKKAVDCISYLLNYGAFRDNCCWNDDVVTQQKLKRQLEADNEKVVESLSKKPRYDSSNSASSGSEDDCAPRD